MNKTEEMEHLNYHEKLREVCCPTGWREEEATTYYTDANKLKVSKKMWLDYKRLNKEENESIFLQ